eukprot:TRINITY_DN20129_c0_g2_i1.p1 TRINITY_DN20129_c0_g2~~TRINITY_DN20129_c0_g2_i1.p1  ORF type:complete len:3110 (+),score=241.13 TRINITY_DN20129_c0_g2_i1:65-9331(+)
MVAALVPEASPKNNLPLSSRLPAGAAVLRISRAVYSDVATIAVALVALSWLNPVAAAFSESSGEGLCDARAEFPHAGCPGFWVVPAPAPRPRSQVVPCAVRHFDERCDLDFSACEGLEPGADCEVTCRSPFFGAPATASCSSDNADLDGGLVWQEPSCALVCPDPSPTPDGYQRTSDGWACSDGYDGNISVVCAIRQEDCVAELQLSGCKPHRPCKPLEVSENLCHYNVRDCWNVPHGSSCEISCEPPFVGVSTIATCPENNTDPDQSLTWEAPDCKIQCVDPAAQHPGYVKSSVPGRLAECAPNFLGVAHSECNLSPYPECEASLLLEGCYPPPSVASCAEIVVEGEDRCLMDVSACGRLDPGASCAIPCISPFVGETSRAHCSSANSDPLNPPSWERPICIPTCEEPASENWETGYVKTEKGIWQCDVGFLGQAVVTCEAIPFLAGCGTRLVYRGCEPISPKPCGALQIEDKCMFTAVGCDSVEPGDLCIVYCRKPYTPSLERSILDAWGSSGGWPAHCDKLNANSLKPPRCLKEASLTSYTDCFADRCDIVCPELERLPTGYQGNSTTGYSCASGYAGTARAVCTTDPEEDCVPRIRLSGCNKIHPCMRIQDSCMFDAWACRDLAAGSSCEVRCRPPYVGFAKVATCPAGNIDENAFPQGGDPDCVLECPLPVAAYIPDGYVMSSGELVCASGFAGTANFSCQMVESGAACQLEYSFGGCMPTQPCMGVAVDSNDLPCSLNISLCVNLPAGSSCEVRCGNDYEGNFTIAVCPADNLDPKYLMPFVEPDCTPICPSPVPVPEGYVLANGAWQCSSGYGGLISQTCNVDPKTCGMQLELFGCVPTDLVPCANLTIDDPCMFELDDCNGLHAGSQCDVRCKLPYIGKPSVAFCPGNNTDPSQPPIWTAPKCVPNCPNPDASTPMYIGTAHDLQCSEGFFGFPYIVCGVTRHCELVSEFRGCSPAMDCSPVDISVEDKCRLEASTCVDLSPNSSCEVRCKYPYVGEPAVAVCPAENTVRFQPFLWQEPICNLNCSEPANAPAGYLKVGGKWYCASGYTGSAVASCSTDTNCAPMFTLSGCLELKPCAPIVLNGSVACALDVAACSSLAPGSTCEVTCKSGYEGTSSRASCPANNTSPSTGPSWIPPTCAPRCPELNSDQATAGYTKNSGSWKCAGGYWGEASVACNVSSTCELVPSLIGCQLYSSCAPLTDACMFDTDQCIGVAPGASCTVNCKAPYMGQATGSCPADNKDVKRPLSFSPSCSLPPCPTLDNDPVGYVNNSGVWECAPGFGGQAVELCTLLGATCEPTTVMSGCVPLIPCAALTVSSNLNIDVSDCTSVMAGHSCSVRCADPFAGEPTTATCFSENLDPGRPLDWRMPSCFLGVPCQPPCASRLDLVAPGSCNGPIQAGGSCWTTCRYGGNSQCAAQADVLYSPKWANNFELLYDDDLSNLNPGASGNITSDVLPVGAWLIAQFEQERNLSTMDIAWGESAAKDYDIYALLYGDGQPWPGVWQLLRRFRDMPDLDSRVDSVSEVWRVKTQQVKIQIISTYARASGKIVIDEVQFTADLPWGSEVTHGYTVFMCPKDNLDPNAQPLVWRPCQLRCDVCSYQYADASSQQYVLSTPWYKSFDFGTASLMGVAGAATDVASYRLGFVDRRLQPLGDLALVYGDDDPSTYVFQRPPQDCCVHNKFQKVLPLTRLPPNADALQILLQVPHGEVPGRSVGMRIGIKDSKPPAPPPGLVTTSSGSEDRRPGKDTCDYFRCGGFSAPHGHRRRRIHCGGYRCFERECCEIRAPLPEHTELFTSELFGPNSSAAIAPLAGGRFIVCLADSFAKCGTHRCTKVRCHGVGARGDQFASLEAGFDYLNPVPVGIVLAPLSANSAVLCYGKGWFNSGAAPGEFGVCRMLHMRGPYYDGGKNLLAFSPEVTLHLGHTGPEWAVGQIRLAQLGMGLVAVCYTAFRPFRPWTSRDQAVFCNLLEQDDTDLREVYEAPVLMDRTPFTSFAVARLYPGGDMNWKEGEAGPETTTSTTLFTSTTPYGATSATSTTSTTATTTTFTKARSASAVACYLREHPVAAGWLPRPDLVKLAYMRNYYTSGLREIKCCVLRPGNDWTGHRRRAYPGERCLYIANATDGVTLTQAGPGVVALCYRDSGGGRCALLTSRGSDPDLLQHVSDVIVAPVRSPSRIGSRAEEMPPSVSPLLLGPQRFSACYRSSSLNNESYVRCVGFDVQRNGLMRMNDYSKFNVKDDVQVMKSDVPVQFPRYVAGVDGPSILTAPFGNDTFADDRRSLVVCDTRTGNGSWMFACRLLLWRGMLTTTTTTTAEWMESVQPPVVSVRRRVPRRKFFFTSSTTTPPPRTTETPPTTTMFYPYEFTTTLAPPPYTPGVYVKGIMSLMAPADAVLCGWQRRESLEYALVQASKWSFLTVYATEQANTSIIKGNIYAMSDVVIQQLKCTESRRLTDIAPYRGGAWASREVYDQLRLANQSSFHGRRMTSAAIDISYNVRLADGAAAEALAKEGIKADAHTAGFGNAFVLTLQNNAKISINSVTITDMAVESLTPQSTTAPLTTTTMTEKVWFTPTTTSTTFKKETLISDPNLFTTNAPEEAGPKNGIANVDGIGSGPSEELLFLISTIVMCAVCMAGNGCLLASILRYRRQSAETSDVVEKFDQPYDDGIVFGDSDTHLQPDAMDPAFSLPVALQDDVEVDDFVHKKATMVANKHDHDPSQEQLGEDGNDDDDDIAMIEYPNAADDVCDQDHDVVGVSAAENEFNSDYDEGEETSPNALALLELKPLEMSRTPESSLASWQHQQLVKVSSHGPARIGEPPGLLPKQKPTIKCGGGTAPRHVLGHTQLVALPRQDPRRLRAHMRRENSSRQARPALHVHQSQAHTSQPNVAPAVLKGSEVEPADKHENRSLVPLEDVAPVDGMREQLKAAAEHAVSSKWDGYDEAARNFMAQEGGIYAQHGMVSGGSLVPQDAFAERFDSSSLPAGWSQRQSRQSGATYYVHNATRIVQWNRPLDSVSLSSNEAGRAKRQERRRPVSTTRSDGTLDASSDAIPGRSLLPNVPRVIGQIENESQATHAEDGHVIVE